MRRAPRWALLLLGFAAGASLATMNVSQSQVIGLAATVQAIIDAHGTLSASPADIAWADGDYLPQYPLVNFGTSDPQDGTPANRPACAVATGDFPSGEGREFYWYVTGSKLCVCTDDSVPTWLCATLS